MIQLSIKDNGDPQVTMQSTSPTVYLDHWALRWFSEDQELAGRLTAGVTSRGGTLAISWVNLAEFTKVTVEEQARKAENLIEAILPQVFFLEVNPFVVIERENKLLGGGPLIPIPPHADVDFLKVIVGLNPDSVNPLSARDLFNVVRDEGSMQRFNNLADTVVERIEALRSQLETDLEFRSAIAQSPSGTPIQRGTRFILRELVHTLLVDSRTKMTRNHAIDLFHAVVPAAYCDLVLLDKHWETQVDRVHSRLISADIAIPVARVFSGKSEGVNRFLNELESG
jgi:hypothetical protein